MQLRVEAFEYLQLPFVIKEGSVGRLKLQVCAPTAAAAAAGRAAQATPSWCCSRAAACWGRQQLRPSPTTRRALKLLCCLCVCLVLHADPLGQVARRAFGGGAV